MGLTTKQAIASGSSLVLLFALSASVKGCYSMSQHDRRFQSEFRDQIFSHNRIPQQEIIVAAEGVTRKGPLNRGAAIQNSSGHGNDPAVLLVANSPDAECWYSTLRVTEGTQNLPFLEKLGGGQLTEEYFMNAKFNSGYDCMPVPSAPAQSPSTTPVTQAAPAAKP